MPTLNLPWVDGTQSGSARTWWRCGETGKDAEGVPEFREVRATVVVDRCRSFSFSFALDLKSEIKQELFSNNVLSILLGKLVGTGSIKNSRTVLPGWDPE